MLGYADTNVFPEDYDLIGPYDSFEKWKEVNGGIRFRLPKFWSNFDPWWQIELPESDDERSRRYREMDFSGYPP